MQKTPKRGNTTWINAALSTLYEHPLWASKKFFKSCKKIVQKYKFLIIFKTEIIIIKILQRTKILHRFFEQSGTSGGHFEQGIPVI